MEKDNKETIVEIITAFLVVIIVNCFSNRMLSNRKAIHLLWENWRKLSFKDPKINVFPYSVYTGNQYLIFGTIVSASISIWFWYESNITKPIQQLQEGIKELHKDLNTRKEIEDMKIKMQEVLLRLKDKKAGINPFLFIIILAIIAMIILYLKDKGFI